MKEAQLKRMASQLRKPEGSAGKLVGEEMNIGNNLINRYTMELLDASAEDNILEIGMGNGFFVKGLLAGNEGLRYTGCDYSLVMVEEAMARNAKFVERGEASFLHASATNLPFEDNSFDKVFAVNTIYFWDEPGVELTEIRRVLKPGGRFFLAIRPKEVMFAIPVTKYNFTGYSKEELVAILEQNNYTVEDVVEREEPDFNGLDVGIPMSSMIAIAIK